MIFLKTIFDKIKNVKLTKTEILFIGLVVFMLLFLNQCNRTASLKEEVKQVERVAARNLNNYLAQQDSVRIEKNKNGQLVASIKGYEYDINTLTSANKVLIDSYRKQLNINKDLRKVNMLLKADIQIKDSIINSRSSVTATSDSTYALSFDDSKKIDKYNWRDFTGKINLYRKDSNLTITSSQFNINHGIELVAAVVEDETGFNRLKITTPFPGVEFTNIQNIKLVDDKLNVKQTKKAGWSVGVGAGYGFSTNGTTILANPFIGVGVYWSPKWLRF